jgi:hypothetical protein
MLALAEYEAGVHVNGCGLHDSIASEDPYFAVEDRKCPVCAALDLQGRVRGKREYEREHGLDAAVPRAGDGRTTFVRLLSPAEVAKTSTPSPRNTQLNPKRNRPDQNRDSA